MTGTAPRPEWGTDPHEPKDRHSGGAAEVIRGINVYGKNGIAENLKEELGVTAPSRDAGTDCPVCAAGMKMCPSRRS